MKRLLQSIALAAAALYLASGAFPAQVQNYTVYAAARSARSNAADAARDLLETLAGAQLRSQLAAFGMEPP